MGSLHVSKKIIFDLDELEDFRMGYVSKYTNFYSVNFEKLNVKDHFVKNEEDYLTKVRSLTKKNKDPYSVYEIYDSEKKKFRVGYSSYSPNVRMKWYLNRAFQPTLSPKSANIYREIRSCDSRKNALKRFRMIIRFVYDSIESAQSMEVFLTIFRNKCDNTKGFDLSINNNYNKIVGELMKIDLQGKFLKKELNPLWKDLTPESLKKAVLEGKSTEEMQKQFNVSRKTILRRFQAYQFGVKSIYDLKDARAYLLKPHIIESFYKGLNQEEFFVYCEEMEINIFNRFEFKKNKENARGTFFRRMLKQIWGISKHKELRYSLIAQDIRSIINRINITPGEAKKKLSNKIIFKYEREFDRICRQKFGMNFVKIRDKTFKPLIEELLIKFSEKRNTNISVAIELGLCKKDDSNKNKEKASGLIRNYVKRNYGKCVTEVCIILINTKNKRNLK